MAPSEASARTLRLSHSPMAAPDAVTLVLDTTWTQASATIDQGLIGLRESAERVLSSRALITETAALLDGWASAAGVVDAMAVDGTSFWYKARLGHWMWLEELVLWLAIVDALVHEIRPTAIECARGTDALAIRAARLIGHRDALPFHAADVGDEPVSWDIDALVVSSGPGSEAVVHQARLARLQRKIRNLFGGGTQDRRRRTILSRVEALGSDPQRPLLVVLNHARQRVETASGPRMVNAYLGPIVDRLRGTRLDPIEFEPKLELRDDDAWRRLNTPDGARLLPGAALGLSAGRHATDPQRGHRAAALIRAASASAVIFGIDVGPALTERVAYDAAKLLPGQARAVARTGDFLRRLRPAGILLADEYHRQEWLAAAEDQGIPVIAVQHGIIYRSHQGYVHSARPDALRLPQRTYVFGEWERHLLVTSSVYREDEVHVSGSPRLALVTERGRDRAAVRTELGIAPDARLVVVSGTWGTTYRRFHYPIALANIVDRPLPNVHFVVKLHPSEPDEGPYRAVVEQAAVARGLPVPPMTVVKDVDLYRLLAAADAHFGVHSTVLTEAVVTRTPNLLAVGLEEADLLGYVDAGVALPVCDGGQFLQALDAVAAGAITEEAQQAFLEAHFRPGDAGARIAEELLAWLP